MTADELEALNAKVDGLQETLGARIDAVEAKVEQVLALVDSRAVCVPPDKACEMFAFSRSTFDRWLADPAEGLELGPEPVVIRPNGPTGKVLVHLARMQRWLDARGKRRTRLRMA